MLNATCNRWDPCGPCLSSSGHQLPSRTPRYASFVDRNCKHGQLLQHQQSVPAKLFPKYPFVSIRGRRIQRSDHLSEPTAQNTGITGSAASLRAEQLGSSASSAWSPGHTPSFEIRQRNDQDLLSPEASGNQQTSNPLCRGSVLKNWHESLHCQPL